MLLPAHTALLTPILLCQPQRVRLIRAFSAEYGASTARLRYFQTLEIAEFDQSDRYRFRGADQHAEGSLASWDARSLGLTKHRG